MWCHVRLINPTNSHPERINKKDQKIAANLDYSDIVFPLDINDYEKIEDRFQMQVKVNRTKYNFNIFVLPLKFIEKIHNYEITLDEAMDHQEKLEKLISRLVNYNANNKK